MDAVEFVKTIREICRWHKTCLECPFGCEKGGCDICTARDPREFVRIADKWSGENRTDGTEEESRNVLELYVVLADKVDRLANKVDLLAEKIKVAKNMIEESRSLTDATFGEVDERFAEMDAQIAMCMRRANDATKTGNGGEKKKRTRIDVLVEAFPEAVCDAHGIPCACPCDFGLTECGGGDCVECRREHWCAEAGD